jgi:hypothetical protein
VIEFVIAPDEFREAPADAVEPVVDGLSLVDIVKRADEEIAFGGLVPTHFYVGELLAAYERGGAERMRVLGCVCGDADCSHVAVRLDVTEDTVIWSDFWATCRPGGAFGPRAYPELRRYEFAKDQYVSAISKPSHRAAPVRESHDVGALAAGVPRDPARWMREMTMAFGRDFVTPYEPEATKSVVVSGLRALRDAREPVTEEVLRTWAASRRFAPDAIDRYVEWFQQIPL